jgi:hypothetical protein
MLRGLGSASRSRSGYMMLLAPSAACVPDAFRDVEINPGHYEHVLSQLQQLRGRVYLQDGAITASQLAANGRHILDVDAQSWHIVSLRGDGEVTGCARYRVHREDVTPESLGAWNSALARHVGWQWALRLVFRREIDLARHRNVQYVEVGGWAIAEELRFSPESADVALATYALAHHLGGCVGITTATVRNCSARILRKIGGQSLDFAAGPLPAYYDPQYRCEMELLRFDSDQLNPKYQSRLDRIARRFLDVPVLCAAAGEAEADTTPARSPWADVHVPCGVGDLAAAVAC